jgi:hypothetical protein
MYPTLEMAIISYNKRENTILFKCFALVIQFLQSRARETFLQKGELLLKQKELHVINACPFKRNFWLLTIQYKAKAGSNKKKEWR